MTTTATDPAVMLLDETDVVKRVIQHGTILLGIAVLGVAAFTADEHILVALGLIAAGFSLFAVAAVVNQQWELPYKGHRLRFVNNPLRGEHLFVDGVHVGRGKLGLRTEMRTKVSDDIVRVIADAGLVSFRCRVFVETPATPASLALTDAQLLAEVRRRGIQA